jgi:asparagine synthase (glutamine-hydrolysing)
MCGIAGELRLGGGPADRAFVRRACATMHHRGPDDDAYHVDGSIALGMCRLGIIGLRDAPRLPHSADGNVVCAFNGEIYNHREIRQRLRRHGIEPEGASDAHVIPGAYALYGDDFVRELDGMFAIALYDAAKQQLILARDRLGKKPLFYSETPDGGVVFASELSALMMHPDVPREISADAIDQYLSYRVIAEPNTIYRAVRKLAAGSQLVVRAGLGARATSYWEPAFSDALRDVAHDEAADELHRRLSAAVDARLEAEVPLGAMLSGGLDSSLVAAMAKARLPGTLNTFSIGFADPAFDEALHARRAARHVGAEHHHYEITAGDALEAIDPILMHAGEPYAFPSAIACYYMYRLAAEHVTVVLTGDGADELLAGYDRYRRFTARWGERAADETLSDVYERVLIDGLRHDVKRRLTTTAFVDSLAGPRQRNYLDEKFRATAPSSEPLSRVMQVDCRFWLTDAQLVKVDRMAMAHSVEPRSPMLDWKFVEYASALPPAMKLAGEDAKAILRQVARGYLPEAIVNRRKQELAVPLERWLMDALWPRIERVLTSEQALSRGYFEPDALQAFVRARRPEDSYALWTLFMLERWHCLFVDDADRGEMPIALDPAPEIDQGAFGREQVGGRR